MNLNLKFQPVSRNVLWVFLLTACVLQAQKSKPNIIIFISDDQSQIDVGCYGNTDVYTPNMDQLAMEGMRFTAAYAATPMCAPSRSNMLTGLYPFRNGSQMNHFALNPETKTLPDYLKKLGYYVAIAGKVDVYPKPDFDRHIGEYFGKYFPVENRNDPRNATTEFINGYFKGENKNKPLCLIVATWLPHVPWQEGDNYAPEKLKLPDYLVDTPQTRKALAAYYQSIAKADKMLGKILESVDQSGEGDNTVFMFFSDQGTQFPGAKWTTYDQGLNVPFVVRWPGKVKAGTTTDALISLTDLTPTLIDLAGGEPIENLDGTSFKDVLLGKKEQHRDYVFGETSMEPQYWYNYTPSRTVIDANGWQYIKNYHPERRFITHIDKVEQNMFYFDSWVEKAKASDRANFLLNRYSYRPPEELYNLKTDPWETENLIKGHKFSRKEEQLKRQLNNELLRQGEGMATILQGDLPVFHSNSYSVSQGMSVSDLSFERDRWSPKTLIMNLFIDGTGNNGVLCEYFNQFRLILKNGKLGIVLRDGREFFSDILSDVNGHLLFQLSNKGKLSVSFNGADIVNHSLEKDFTAVNSGYFSCGLARMQQLNQGEQNYFKGKISGITVSMNKLIREPR
ncbi:sulfatase family protein [Galbibacter pacificus]|uniref:Sulfatase n=1 Tax=Galbibacter pacificus TaxID=2996052 RepID=A0ABT6FN29_9FLAO|nr:sulfatase [Galbibacter pacificus]MDG3581191.1 sulfatase [Galbibacter pacificus]MDG3584669.1 sulfatase [Galbibacter pacificus]